MTVPTRKFENTGKRSNIKNVAPDPGRVRSFFIRSSAGQDAADLRNGKPAGENSPLAISPAPLATQVRWRWERHAQVLYRQE
jgi:hypothetical protein